MEFIRPQGKTLREALGRPTSVIQVLIGPRQVGKTTLARQIERSLDIPAIYATADSATPLDGAWIETQWRRAVAAATQPAGRRPGRKQDIRRGGPLLLILDEVQKVRGWNETLKFLWDARHEGPEIRVLILGSSALLVQEGLAESLAGRFFLHRCSHWGFPECRDAFGWSLEQWLYYGGYPGAAVFIEDEPVWKRYVTDSLIETVLARDVFQMAKVAKPALLRNLFGLAAALPAQIVSYTKMLGQLQDAGNTTTLAHYLRLLESAFLVSGLELFSRGKLRRRGSSPKLVLWNNALVNALSPKTLADAIADPAWWGRLVENAVGAHLSTRFAGLGGSVTYWREGPLEVDFVVSHGSDLWAIEVKSGRSGKIAGLQHFRTCHPEAKALLVGGPGIPLSEFFSQDPSHWMN